MSFDAKKIKDDLVQYIRDWFEKNGKDCNAVLGISGGKDSTIAAAICVEALGKDRVVGVLMPNGIQADIDDSLEVVKLLGIPHITINIAAMVDSVKLGIGIGNYSDDSINLMNLGISNQTDINLPPRIRMTLLYAVSQSLNGRVINTSNLSESYVGYSTKYGDSAGDVGLFLSLTQTEVKAIGHELGLPAHLVDKTPSDGLCGKTDEDNLGFSYKVLDKYIRTGDIEDEVTKERIDHLHKINLFKTQLMDRFQL